MAVKFANLASSTLASSLTNSATSISVTDASSFPTLGAGDYFYASIGEGSLSEIVKVTAVSSNTFTAVRGQDGTTARSHDSGTSVALRVVAAALDDIASAADTESVSISGDTMTGTLNMGANAITSTGTISSGAITATSLTLPSSHSMQKITVFGGGHEWIGTSNNTLELSGASINLNGAQGTGTANLKMGGTTVIDSSRNLTNIGTISSGAITSSGHLSLPDNKYVRLGTDNDFIIYHDGATNYIQTVKQDSDLIIRGNDGGTNFNALTIDMSAGGNATFAGTISSGAITSTGNMSLSNSGTGNNITINRTDSSTSAVFHIGSSRGYVGTTTDHEFEIRQNDTPAITIDTSGNTTVENNLVVDGNLTVSGTTTTLNTATLDVEDKNITLNYSTGDSSASANGAGITIQDAVDSTTDATILWDATYDEFGFSHPISVVGNSTFTGSATDTTSAATFRNSANSVILRVRNDGRVLIPSGYLFAQHSDGAYFTGSIKARGGITNDGGNNLSISSGGTDITFNSKNFTSVGTISSGAITSSSTGQFENIGIGIAPSTPGLKVYHTDNYEAAEFITNQGGSLARFTDNTSTNIEIGIQGGMPVIRTSSLARLTVDGANVRINSGDLQMASTTVIDSSRNLTNIGTISSGSITSSGNITAGSGSGFITAGTTSGYVYAKSLRLANAETTDTDFQFAYQMIVDANDVDSDVPSHGNTAGSGPFGVYFLGDNGGTTKTLGSGLVKLWHTGHFTKAHIDHFVGLQGGTQNLTAPDISVTGNLDVSQSIRHTGDTNTAINFFSDQVEIRTGGTPRLSITNNDFIFTNTQVRFDATMGIGAITYAPIEGNTEAERNWLNIHRANDASYIEITNRTPAGKVVLSGGLDGGGGEVQRLEIEGGSSTKSVKILASTDLNLSSTSKLTHGTTTVIDSSRNLTNIGTISSGAISTSGLLTVNGSSGTDGSIRIEPNSGKGSEVSHIHYGTTGDWYIRSANTSGKIYLQDSGGIVTIGTTSTTPAFSTGNGHAFHTGDASHISRNGGVALVVNRSGSNGEAVQVRRDGTHVGGLGIAGGANLTVNSAGTGGYGRLQDNGSDVAIWWTNGFYPATDNAKDLGVSSSSGRWRRLYMADAIWMGGSKIVDSSRNLTNIGTISSGAITSSARSTFSGGLDTNSSQLRVKISPWTGTTYGYGMKSGMTFGGLSNNYALTFQVNSSAGRGFWWGRDEHSDAQGAMALTNDGKLTVSHSLRLGYGISDTTTPGATHALDVSGSISSGAVTSTGLGTFKTLTLTGDSDDLTFTDTGGDWSIKNAQQNNGIVIYDGSGGVEIHYNNAAVAEFDSAGGMNIVSGELRMGGTTRISSSGTGTFGYLNIVNSAMPTLTLYDNGNGGGGAAEAKIEFTNTAGTAVAIGYTDDQSGDTDLIISTNAAGTYGGYLGLTAAAIADAQSDIILEPKTDVRIATGGLKVGTTTVIDSSLNIGAGGAADSSYDLKVYGLARFEGVANFTNNVQVGGITVIDSSRVLQDVTANASIITSGTINNNRLNSDVLITDGGTYSTGFTGDLDTITGFRIHRVTGFTGTDHRAFTGHHNLLQLPNTSSSGPYDVQLAFTTVGSGTPEFKFRSSGTTWSDWVKVFNDGYHPNADKWTTARTLTLTGDVTGSVSIDGSGNVSLATTKISTIPKKDTAENISAHWEWQDNQQVRFGNGADFRIYHNGTNTYLRNYNHSAGNIYFQGENTSGTNQALIYMQNNTARTYVRLFENGGERLKTTSTGVELALGMSIGGSTVFDSARDIQNAQAETGTTGLRFKTGAWFYDSANQARFQFVASSHNYYKTDGNGGKHFFFDGNSTTEASADAFIDAGGNGHFGGNVTAYSSSISSDARLKENIRPIESATETVKQLNGVVFDWKKTERGTDQLGFIAQEIEQVLPSLVTEVDTLKDENTETHKTVNYAALVPMLVESIKELTKRIEELENGNH